MLFSQRFGDPFGRTTPLGYHVARAPGADVDRALSWDPSHASGVVYHLFLDGRPRIDTTETAAVLPADLAIRDHVQVFETSAQNADESCARFADAPLDAVQLTWTAAEDAHEYLVYRSPVPGAIAHGAQIHREMASGADNYAFTDSGDGPGLADGTYYYAVQTLDAAGNPTASNEVSQTVDAAPSPPTGLNLTFTP